MHVILLFTILNTLLPSSLCSPRSVFLGGGLSNRATVMNSSTMRTPKVGRYSDDDTLYLQKLSKRIRAGKRIRNHVELIKSKHSLHRVREVAGLSPTKTERSRLSGRSSDLDLSPTPSPTGTPSGSTTVYVTSADDFSLLLPKYANELIADAESDAVSYCKISHPGCSYNLPDGLITASTFSQGSANDGSNTAWIQVTGCMDPSKFPFAQSDDGGQMDVRFPNGAQCTYGGYGASFIEQVEPSANRFCLRCCSEANDQVNCNSHQDNAGCVIAIPGKYDYPELGVSCS